MDWERERRLVGLFDLISVGTQADSGHLESLAVASNIQQYSRIGDRFKPIAGSFLVDEEIGFSEEGRMVGVCIESNNSKHYTENRRVMQCSSLEQERFSQGLDPHGSGRGISVSPDTRT